MTADQPRTPPEDTPGTDPALQPVFVLVRPQMGENIGAAARAMLNFGLERLRLVDPRDVWPNPRAVAMASGAAGRVLDHAGVFADVAQAVGDCDYVFATTARDRESDAARGERRARDGAGPRDGRRGAARRGAVRARAHRARE
ncbi:RNA methyltransferase [Frigidibacter albus]